MARKTWFVDIGFTRKPKKPLQPDENELYDALENVFILKNGLILLCDWFEYVMALV